MVGQCKTYPGHFFETDRRCKKPPTNELNSTTVLFSDLIVLCNAWVIYNILVSKFFFFFPWLHIDRTYRQPINLFDNSIYFQLESFIKFKSWKSITSGEA